MKESNILEQAMRELPNLTAAEIEMVKSELRDNPMELHAFLYFMLGFTRALEYWRRRMDEAVGNTEAKP